MSALHLHKLFARLLEFKRIDSNLQTLGSKATRRTGNKAGRGWAPAFCSRRTGSKLNLIPKVMMKTKVGVMGSAEAAASQALRDKAIALGTVIAASDAILLTGRLPGWFTRPAKLLMMPGACTLAVFSPP